MAKKSIIGSPDLGAVNAAEARRDIANKNEAFTPDNWFAVAINKAIATALAMGVRRHGGTTIRTTPNGIYAAGEEEFVRAPEAEVSVEEENAAALAAAEQLAAPYVPPTIIVNEKKYPSEANLELSDEVASIHVYDGWFTGPLSDLCGISDDLSDVRLICVISESDGLHADAANGLCPVNADALGVSDSATVVLVCVVDETDRLVVGEATTRNLVCVVAASDSLLTDSEAGAVRTGYVISETDSLESGQSVAPVLVCVIGESDSLIGDTAHTVRALLRVNESDALEAETTGGQVRSRISIAVTDGLIVDSNGSARRLNLKVGELTDLLETSSSKTVAPLYDMGNLITNGGFTDGLTGWGWSTASLVVIDNGYDGFGARVGPNTVDGKCGGSGFTFYIQQTIATVPGVLYNLSFKVKPYAVDEGLWIDYGAIPGGYWYVLPPSGTWTTVSRNFTASSVSTIIRAGGSCGVFGVGRFIIDDVNVHIV